MRGRGILRSLGVGACLCAAACSLSAPDERAPPAVDAPTPTGFPKSNRELPTTSANIFFSNLRGQIEVHRATLARDPGSVLAHRDLGGLLYVLARHNGEVDEVQAAIDEVSRAIELAPNNATLYVMRAQQVQTLHRFAAARADLERARELGASPSTLAAVESELDFAEGRYDVAIPAIRRAAAENPTMLTVARLALLEHDLGNRAAAEHAFDRAESLIRDASPIPVSWLYTQRGIVAMHSGEHERGILFLREAVRRTPGNIAAEEHLAEALAEAGQSGEAVALYESIVERSSDPEFKGALAELYRAGGRIAEADRLAALAKQDFERRIARYPESMAAHATDFFLGEGRDPARALELAQGDVRLRPTVHAYTSLARAQLANGDLPAARAAIDRALAMPVRSPDTLEVAARISNAIRQPLAADAHG